ncbi:MAG: 16S rRNA (adenine(1518)-N(6)/adenine(1519)-N(6))-dimethyltransferase RsmA [Bryobacteraceae bacterium]
MARQRLGQHFLRNGAILERIAAAACPQSEVAVVEIGPGRGALTEKLLARAQRVVAIELDAELVRYLRRKFAGESRLEMVEGDALSADLEQWGSVPIVGNLPYYAATPILERAIRLKPPRAVFLIQKEVAERLVAQPGQRAYGYLTLATALFASARLLFEVKPGAFVPPPAVDSAVVLLEPRAVVPEAGGVLELISHAFRHKRKTLRNNLAPVYGKTVETWPEAGLRAEQIPLSGFLELYARVER